jgi:hypothetical protein
MFFLKEFCRYFSLSTQLRNFLKNNLAAIVNLVHLYSTLLNGGKHRINQARLHGQ